MSLSNNVSPKIKYLLYAGFRGVNFKLSVKMTGLTEVVSITLAFITVLTLLP